MRNRGILIVALLLPAVIAGTFGCNGEETTPAPARTSAQLSTVELSDAYTLPEGAVISALEVYVDGTLWKRVENLSDFGPNDQVYVVGKDSAGRSSIRFGDGEHGARLPSRNSKVVATYRLSSDAGGDGGAS
jgi:hypothetical protein